MIVNTPYVHGGDIYHNRITLDFSVNVNPLGMPEQVKNAVINTADHLDKYPDPYCGPLREKLARTLHTDPDWILCGNGAAELIYQLIGALQPERTLLPVPSFADYETALKAEGHEPVHYELKREEGFLITDQILPSITEDVSLLMLCNPNNPTGRLIDRPLLERILERCRETGTWLFVDECFGDLTDTETPSLADMLKPGDRVFLLRAFTKIYAMAGLRLGYAVCPNRETVEKICLHSQPWNVSTVAQEAGIAALDCGEWAEKTRSLIREEKRYLVGELTALGISVLHSDANFLLLSGVPDLYEKLLKKGILIRNCDNYHGLMAGDCRIAVRTHEENKALIGAIREVLNA